jgi:uncharacterized alkaline shock family protein YloU
MDSIKHFEDDRCIGRTNFHGGLLNSLVVLSVQDIVGVVRMAHNPWKFRSLFNPSLRSGVDVKFEYDGVAVDVCIWVKYGFTAADISYRVQESVMGVVAELVNDKIKCVNVKIVGVEYGVQSKEVS